MECLILDFCLLGYKNRVQKNDKKCVPSWISRTYTMHLVHWYDKWTVGKESGDLVFSFGSKLSNYNNFEGRLLSSIFSYTEWKNLFYSWHRAIMGESKRQHELRNSPVRKSKLSGWLRPSMMTCKVCAVVCNLSAVFSIPSFSRDEFIFCCISGFPISHSVPPMKDKNLQRKEKPKIYQ